MQIHYQHNNTGVLSLQVPIPHASYVDRLLSRNCFEELFWLFKTANAPAKEISESYAAYHHLKKFVNLSGETVIHIGDGSMCRTGALFAFLTKSYNVSIDPIINMEKIGAWQTKYAVQNFEYHKQKVQEYPVTQSPVVITMVHAHVNILDVVRIFPSWKVIYTNACCQPQQQFFHKDFPVITVMDKDDLGILSPQRHVKIYVNPAMKRQVLTSLLGG